MARMDSGAPIPRAPYIVEVDGVMDLLGHVVLLSVECHCILRHQHTLDIHVVHTKDNEGLGWCKLDYRIPYIDNLRHSVCNFLCGYLV